MLLFFHVYKFDNELFFIKNIKLWTTFDEETRFFLQNKLSGHMQLKICVHSSRCKAAQETGKCSFFSQDILKLSFTMPIISIQKIFNKVTKSRAFVFDNLGNFPVLRNTITRDSNRLHNNSLHRNFTPFFQSKAPISIG